MTGDGRPSGGAGPWIDPEITAALAGGPARFGALADEDLVALRRAQVAATRGAIRSPDVERTDRRVPGAAGAPDIVLRVHRPKRVTAAAPCLYWIHGGGYLLGSYATEDLWLERLCLALGCVATSVEYRLAPETPYPGALVDCLAGLAWVRDCAGELGVDPSRLGVGGVSAGAGLAAAVALATRDRGDPALAFQLLVYPMLDDRDLTRSSRWEVPVWSPVNNRYGWQGYLGGLYGAGDVPSTAAPARAEDLSGLPSAFVCVGSADIFLDEDIDYARGLIHAGVPLELHVYPGAVHGFQSVVPAVSVAVRATQDIVDWLDRVMAGGS